MKFGYKKILLLGLLTIFLINNGIYANSSHEDFMEKVFTPSIQGNHIIGGGQIGTTKQSVGNFLLKEGVEINIGANIGTDQDEQEARIKKKPSFVISVTQFLLRVTVAISITMIIINGILYIIKTHKGSHDQDTINNVIFIVVGIVIALSSVIIIRVIGSISHTLIQEISYHFSLSYLLPV